MSHRESQSRIQGQSQREGQGKRSPVGCSRLVVAVNGGLEASDTDSFQDSSLRLGGSVRQGGGQAGSQSRSSSLLRQQPHTNMAGHQPTLLWHYAPGHRCECLVQRVRVLPASRGPSLLQGQLRPVHRAVQLPRPGRERSIRGARPVCNTSQQGTFY